MNTTTSTISEQPDNGIADIKRLPILIAMIIGAFFSVLNETLLNIALPTLEFELDIAKSTLQWLATGYMLVVAILIPVSALLVQWFTTRQMFIGALSLFTLGTLICGFAPGFPILLLGRLVQAFGTGLMLPVLMNTIMVLYPPEKRGAAMGSVGLVIMFAPAIGPTLSGFILESLNWRWLFYFVLPFAIISIGVAFVYLKNVTEVTKPKVDIWSVILSTLAFGGIVYGFSQSGTAVGGWTNPEVYLSSSIGIISLIIFVWRQLLAQVPILDMRAFKSPMFALTAVLLIIMMMTMFSTITLLPFFMLGVMVLSSFAAGLVLMPGGILNGLLSPIMGKLFDKFGPRVLVIPGCIFLVFIMWLFTRITPSTSSLSLIILYASLMVALAMIMMPTQTNGLNQLPRKYYPHGIAILNTMQQVAGAIGVAFFISLMAKGQEKYLSNSADPASVIEQVSALNAGVNGAFQIGFICSIVALVLALFMKRAVAPEEKHEEVSS